MTTAKDLIHAHELIDRLANNYRANEEELDHLRNCLPERPEGPTVNDLFTRVHDAWIKANPHEWGFETPKENDDWLFDLRNDLIRIIEEQDAPVVVPALPAGMRIADHVNFGRVVVSPGVGPDGRYEIFYLEPGMSSATAISEVEPDSLTFIDDEPAHPEFLETEADYENAPNGTIVASSSASPAMKGGSLWESAPYLDRDAKKMAGEPRRVLRWGWGE